MKGTRCIGEQIAFAPRQAEAGTPASRDPVSRPGGPADRQYWQSWRQIDASRRRDE